MSTFLNSSDQITGALIICLGAFYLVGFCVVAAATLLQRIDNKL